MSEDNETHRFDRDGSELAASIVEAVATVSDRDPLALPSLYDVVDAESLSKLLEESGDVAATFQYEGLSVTVTGDGEIVVREPRPSEPIWAELADASTVLVLAESRADDTCRALLAGHGQPHDLLGVTFAGSVHDRLAVWDPVDDATDNATVFSMGAVARSASASDGGGPSLPVRIDAIEDPGDLSTLEVAIHEQLSQWDDSSTRAVACFHSITTLLEHVDERTAGRFVDSLARRLAAAGATAHFHMDPRAHDASTIDRFRDCVDAVVTVRADGTRTVDAT